MSDTEGERPSETTPETASGAAPQAQQPVVPPAPQAPAPTAAAPQAPGSQIPAQPQWQPPQGARPAAAPAGYPPYPQQAPYGAPHAQPYAGQPAAGQQYASSFGPGARPDLAQTQPTAPLGGPATGAVATGTATKKKSGAGKVVGLIVAAAIVGGAAGLGGAYAGVNLFTPAGSSPAAGPSTVTVNNTDSVNQTTAISAKVLPSVVTIQATGTNGAGTGSGVVLTSDGYVVTNTHVVTLDGATSDATIRVTTSDGRVYDAEVVGTDPTYDLAVIKLTDAEGLTPIEFADSSELNVGDQTIAIGAPLGLSNSVTTGIVSALNRSIQIASSAVPDSGDAQDDSQTPDSQTPEGQSPFQFDFGEGDSQAQTPSESISIAVIQTDAAINPGNSGGALVDEEGKLIGINVAIATAGGSSGESGSIGVGFSIPSNIVERVTGEIIENGAATHGLLGASVRDAASVESSTITGAYIAEVVADGAAQAAGLAEGDIVTAFNGVPVTDATDLTAQVRAAAAGSDATVTFVRDGETKTVDVTLGELAL
ncbi:putative serine protease PepD [Microbacterium sp. cf046]|uniref:S1C family serine protease n=1 Tax=Microbacterium sp. cf046 TaxID=1761803 RepID=UPI0008E2D7AF|nr:trypsin-like peptidase domain-containing protein [Microbacterium sp. cf046]SFS07924.1 putative serine protease PepD [Microbacterium sp. cf046]